MPRVQQQKHTTNPISFTKRKQKSRSASALEVILVREDLLTTLAAGHAVLLLLAELGGCELLLLLNGLDLVTLLKMLTNGFRIE